MSGFSDTGRVRTQNEDIFAFDAAQGLAVLADGMGGSNSGGVAAQIAVDSVLSFLRAASAPIDTELLCAAVAHANNRVFDESRNSAAHIGMGTTLVVTRIGDTVGWVAHVGDSRAYRLRGSTLSQLTKDHSVVQELIDAGAITAEEARQAPNRNIITRAIGLEPSLEVDASEFDVADGDVVLLCSDGLSDLLGDRDIAELLIEHKDDLDGAARQLVKSANAAGGTDNVTVVLVAL
ncbi:MAG: Stp1/IreP family PP2C-type Ser/Thr phosphatase [Gammaproteobacteria bacterium]|nr:Stp1/IreP family PP2C-type Ser/Thr phosphatase [Gammaproteobacteria bacterium]